MADYTTSVLIAGAGPAGASTSIFLSKENIPHIIIDKSSFPRDKICGDAMSGKTTGMLKRISADWEKLFVDNGKKSLVSEGIRFAAPNGKLLDVPFLLPGEQTNEPTGFVSRRLVFDDILARQISNPSASFLPNTALLDITEQTDGLLVTIKENEVQKTIHTQMIVGAEGRSSIVAKKMAGHVMEPFHFSAGVRAYYKNVKGLHPQSFIELHFLEDAQPGYLWVFPIADGSANVGLGVLSKTVAAKKLNLKTLMTDMIEQHPSLKERFATASIEGKIEGWGLPLGSKKRPLSGNRFLLTGDAGSLIDPFTGEGIGNAMVSGLVASRVIKKAINSNDFSAALLYEYDANLYKKLWAELRISRYLQLLASKKWLFNFVVSKAIKSKELRETLTCMFVNTDIRKKLISPLFYLKILFNK